MCNSGCRDTRSVRPPNRFPIGVYIGRTDRASLHQNAQILTACAITLEQAADAGDILAYDVEF